MKKLALLLFLFSTLVINAQNSINYKALVKDSGGNVLMNQSVTTQFRILEGVAQTNVYEETHTANTDANGILVLVIGTGTTSDIFTDIAWDDDEHWLNVQVNTGAGLIDMGTTQFRTVPYALSAANVNGLEAIDEGNGLGWRLKDRNPSTFGNVGLGAVDLSYSWAASSTMGATGGRSFVTGENTTAKGVYTTAMGYGSEASGNRSTAIGSDVTSLSYSEVAIGRKNTTYSPLAPFSWNSDDRLLVVGNGDNSSFSDALIILKNGTVTAPSFDLAEITDAKALITKEYADTNLIASGLETLDEGNGEGWRIKGRDPANYGDIGEDAVDLSYSGSSSTTFGATGTRSTAMGNITKASGSNSTALGYQTTASSLNTTAMGNITIASGTGSVAMGDHTNASGGFSTAMGYYTKAEAFATSTFGRFNIGGGSAISWDPLDPAFEIGNGSNSANRDNAFTVLKNGKVGIGEHQPDAFLEIKANNSTNSPTVRLVHEGTTGPRINFTNTTVTTGNYWTLYGGPNDIDADSEFNIYHPNVGNVLRLRGDGDIGVGAVPAYRLDVRKEEAANYVAQVYNTSTSTNANGLKIRVGGANPGILNSFVSFFDGSGSSRGHIVGNGTGVNYNTTSDRRLKTNITDITEALNLIDKIQPRQYEYKTFLGVKEYGFIAQELQPLYAQAVTGTPDSDVEKDPMMVDYGRLTPLLTAGIKELKSEVDTLKDEVGSLKDENSDLKQRLNKMEQLEDRLAALENNNANYFAKDLSEANKKE